MLSEVSTGPSSKFKIPLAVHEAIRGAPGAIGRFVRKTCVPPDSTASFARLREVLPLPVPDAPLFEKHCAAWCQGQQLAESELEGAVAQGWAQLVVFSLNCQYTGRMRCPTAHPRWPTAGLASALDIVGRACACFAGGAAPSFELPDWSEVIAAKSISYGGDETSRALPLSLAGILPGLPGRGVAASVKALDIAGSRVGAWLADPALALFPRAEWPQEAPRAAAQVETRQEWYKIGAKAGRARTRDAAIAEGRVFKVRNRKLLAGAFGVAKGGAPLPGQARAQRPTINMVLASSFQRIMKYDVGALSASPSWVAIPLPNGHMLLWSSDDQASAFYCCELPAAWQPFVTLAEAIPNELVGVSGPGKTHLALRVIPMGWINAPGVAQGPAAPFKSKELEQQWAQHYVDDWDHGEVAPSSLVEELIGAVSRAQLGQRAAYHRSGINVAPDRADHRALVLERMGAGLDGAKLFLLVGFILWAIGQPALSSQAMLMVLGWCVRAAEFRRPFMGFLNSAWAAGRWARPQPVPLGMCDELLGFALALPLAFTELRARVDACVIATDASEHAGGMCYTVELSEQGVACAKGEASAVTLRPGAISEPVQGARWQPRIVLVELFAGAAGRLPVTVVAHVSCEVDPADLAGVSAVGAGLSGPRSKLFYRVPELIEAAEAAFPKHTMWLVENVFSMTLQSRAEFPRALGVAPVFLDAKSLAHVRRPRLCWRPWPVVSFLASGAAVEAKGEGAAARFKVTLAVERLPLAASLLEAWSLLGPEADLLCFARPIPGKRPPLWPAGLEWVSPAAAQLRAADGYRYQVNSYEEGSLFWDAQRERGRLPVPEERGAPMGFDRLYFQAAAQDSSAPSERDAIVESLIGNAFCVQVVAYLLGSWLAQVGALAAAMPGQSCLAVGACEANWNVAPDSQQLGHRAPQLERSLIVEFWPTAEAFRWQRAARISALEVEAAVAGARWRCRAVEGHRCRCLRILDAQAIAAVSTKGRSSARALQPALRRLNSLLLAAAGYPLYGYCDADDVPADAPSRWSFGSGKGEAGSSQAMVTPLTLQRYRAAVDEVVDFWIKEENNPRTPAQVDAGASAFIESRWLNVGSLFEVNNAIAGVAREFPPVRGHLEESWRLAKTWQRLELAGRALPIGPLIAAAFAGAVLQLRNTKSQQQTGAREFVLVRSAAAVALLAKTKANARQSDLCIGMEPSSFMRIFGQVRELLELQDAKLTLRSWRRGGASADVRSHGSMEQTLFRGGWTSARTARLYVQDAVAEATQLSQG
ncbi:unnamed protein product, partial [Prorocentrum cordatum]